MGTNGSKHCFNTIILNPKLDVYLLFIIVQLFLHQFDHQTTFQGPSSITIEEAQTRRLDFPYCLFCWSSPTFCNYLFLMSIHAHPYSQESMKSMCICSNNFY